MIARLVVLTLFAASTVVAQTSKPGELPLDLAYSQRDATRRERPALSPDGRYLAYEIHTPPVKTPDSGAEVEGRYLPSGVPTSAVGFRLWVSDTRTGSAKPACAETANCWRGSWSPDSRKLAFFSDESGELGLWVYTPESGSGRRVGNVKIKPKLLPGDQASWSPDSKTVYVTLQPPATAAAAPATPSAMPAAAASKSEDKPTVTVWRTKQAAAAVGAEEDPTAAMNAFFMKENLSVLAAV